MLDHFPHKILKSNRRSWEYFNFDRCFFKTRKKIRLCTNQADEDTGEASMKIQIAASLKDVDAHNIT